MWEENGDGVRNYPKLSQKSQNRKVHRPSKDAGVTWFIPVISNTRRKAKGKRWSEFTQVTAPLPEPWVRKVLTPSPVSFSALMQWL